MILGEVNFRNEVGLNLSVYDKSGDIHTIPVILDTGFTDYLVLPKMLIDALGIEPKGFRSVTLGDGREVELPRYEMRVEWDNQERMVNVLETDSVPLIGMKMIRGYNVTFQAADGGPVFLYK